MSENRTVQVTLTPLQFRQKVREMATSVGSIAELARQWDVTGQYVGELISGRKSPGAKILKILNGRKVVEEKYVLTLEVEQ